MNRAFSTAALPDLFGGGPGDADVDDAPATRFDVTPFALEDVSNDGVPTPRIAMTSSFVRVKRSADVTWNSDAVGFLDVMGEQQLNLTVNLFCLESSVDSDPYDRSARAAADTLRRRIAELCDLRDALSDVYLEGNDATSARLFAVDAPFIEYVKGLYLWCAEVTEALTALSAGLRTLNPDWLELRRRLDRASSWFFDGLVMDVRRDVATIDAPDLAAKIEELLWAATYAHDGLDKKFG